VRISFLNQEGYLLNHPDAVKHILQSHHLQYSKDVYALKFLKALLGEGLLTNEGASWLAQRRVLQPAFHRKRLSALSTVMTGATYAMFESWQGIAQRGEVLDVAQEMMRLTLRIVGLALLSRDLSNEMDRLGQSFATNRTLLMQYLYTPFPPLGGLRNAIGACKPLFKNSIRSSRASYPNAASKIPVQVICSRYSCRRAMRKQEKA
jgi:cytochrome P450